jgi:hypothetical protein
LDQQHQNLNGIVNVSSLVKIYSGSGKCTYSPGQEFRNHDSIYLGVMSIILTEIIIIIIIIINIIIIIAIIILKFLYLARKIMT